MTTKIVDKALVRAAQTKCGGGKIHAAVQWTTAYEFAVARFNHRNATPAMKRELVVEIEELESKLYAMSR